MGIDDNHLSIDSANTFSLPAPKEIFTGVSITFFFQLLPGIDTPIGDVELDVVAFGADFDLIGCPGDDSWDSKSRCRSTNRTRVFSAGQVLGVVTRRHTLGCPVLVAQTRERWHERPELPSTRRRHRSPAGPTTSRDVARRAPGPLEEVKAGGIRLSRSEVDGDRGARQ